MTRSPKQIADTVRRRVREEIACASCGRMFYPPKTTSQTCGVVCRQMLNGSRSRPASRLYREPQGEHPLTDKSVIVMLEDPRCGLDRSGVVQAVAIVAGLPLFTVKLDKGGWPGGTNAGWPDETVMQDTALPPGWYVELREGELREISHAARARLVAATVGPKLSLRERKRRNAKAARDRRRAAP